MGQGWVKRAEGVALGKLGRRARDFEDKTVDNGQKRLLVPSVNRVKRLDRQQLREGQGCIRSGGRRGGGGLKGGERGVWLGPPSSLGPPMVPAEGGPKVFEASILLALKAPKQKFGCQPQTLEGEEGWGVQGGVPPPPPAVYGRSNTSRGGGGYPSQMRLGTRTGRLLPP